MSFAAFIILAMSPKPPKPLIMSLFLVLEGIPFLDLGHGALGQLVRVGRAFRLDGLDLGGNAPHVAQFRAGKCRQHLLHDGQLQGAFLAFALFGGLLVQALSIATYLAVAQLGEFYALSVVFGLAYGGVMPLYAVLVREFFGARIMGTVFGAVSAFASLGMALGPWAGGYVFDTFHGYTWLHAGSFAIGLAAVAVALSFSTKHRPSLDLGRAAA